MAQVIYYIDDTLNTIPDTTEPPGYIAVTADRVKHATTHQITLTPDGDAAVTGRLKIGYRAVTNSGADGIEWVSDGYGGDLIVDMANGVQTITFEAAVIAFAVLVETTISGADIRVGASGW